MRQNLGVNLAGIIPLFYGLKKTSKNGCERGGIRTPDTVVRSHVL
jgi:hypothetical protein